MGLHDNIHITNSKLNINSKNASRIHANSNMSLNSARNLNLKLIDTNNNKGNHGSNKQNNNICNDTNNDNRNSASGRDKNLVSVFEKVYKSIKCNINKIKIKIGLFAPAHSLMCVPAANPFPFITPNSWFQLSYVKLSVNKLLRSFHPAIKHSKEKNVRGSEVIAVIQKSDGMLSICTRAPSHTLTLGYLFIIATV